MMTYEKHKSLEKNHRSVVQHILGLQKIPDLILSISNLKAYGYKWMWRLYNFGAIAIMSWEYLRTQKEQWVG